jgi:hypothetical protein
VKQIQHEYQNDKDRELNRGCSAWYVDTAVYVLTPTITITELTLEAIVNTKHRSPFI